MLTVALKGTSEQLRNHFLQCHVRPRRGNDERGHGLAGPGQDQRSGSRAAADHRDVPAARSRGRHQPEGVGWRTVCCLRLVPKEDSAADSRIRVSHWSGRRRPRSHLKPRHRRHPTRGRMIEIHRERDRLLTRITELEHAFPQQIAAARQTGFREGETAGVRKREAAVQAGSRAPLPHCPGIGRLQTCASAKR